VELALAMPILLLLVLGIWWEGTYFAWKAELRDSVAEGAVAGALIPGDSCGVAKETARKLYAGSGFDTIDCEVQGQKLTLTATDTLIFNTPWGQRWGLASTQQATLR